EDGIRDWSVTGVQTCALPIYSNLGSIKERQLRVVISAWRPAPIRSRVIVLCRVNHETFRSTVINSVIHFRLVCLRQLMFEVSLEIGRASCREREEVEEVSVL